MHAYTHTCTVRCSSLKIPGSLQLDQRLFADTEAKFLRDGITKLREAVYTPVYPRDTRRLIPLRFKMSVMLETSLGELVIDLEVERCPKTCENFLKLCKVKYYALNAFFNGEFLNLPPYPSPSSALETC